MKLVDTLQGWRSDDLKNYVYLLGGKSNLTRKDVRISFISQALLNKPSLGMVQKVNQRQESTFTIE